MCEIDWSAVSIVGATLLGPILAVWASEWRQQRKQLHDRKEWVFRSLWSTRSSRLHPDHILALNQIDLAFSQKSHPKIADARGLYFAHLDTSMGLTDDSRARWLEAGSNLLVELLHLMATELNISFSKTQAKQASYYPEAYVFTEAQQNELRTLLLESLKNGVPVNIRSVDGTKA